MFKKALKIIAPSIVGSIIGLIIVALVSGVQVAINTIIPVLFGTCCGFIAALYFATKEDNSEDK